LGKIPHRFFIRLVQGDLGKAGIGLEIRRGFDNVTASLISAADSEFSG
jgi:hypothetical protein